MDDDQTNEATQHPVPEDAAPQPGAEQGGQVEATDPPEAPAVDDQPAKLPGADDQTLGAPIAEGEEGFTPPHLRFGPGSDIG